MLGKKCFVISIIALFLPLFSSLAQEQEIDVEVPVLHLQCYESYYWGIFEGDTVMVINMKPVTIFPPKKFKNKKQEKFYWKTVRDVKRTLPYAKLIYNILIETYQYMETLPDEKSRQQHLEKMEKEIFEQYKPVLKKLTLSQGKMLIKLVNRECNQSSYHIIRAFLGSFRAGFWQAFGKLFGVTLKSEWDPTGKDKDIERICVLVEQGML